MSSAPPAGLRGVLFDRDQTLTVTDHEVYRQAAHFLAGRTGLDAAEVGRGLQAHWQAHDNRWMDLRTLEDEAAFWQEYGRTLMHRLGADETHAAALLEAYGYERYLAPVPGARAVLTELRARGLKTGVLSNTLPSVDLTLRAAGLDDLIDVALASAALGVHKPEPQAYLLAAQAMELEPEQILFVDDLPENVAGARRAGMQAALIDLSGQHPDALHNLEGVLDLVSHAR